MKIAEQQYALNQAGFNAGKVDGLWGPITKAAVEDCIDWQVWLAKNGFWPGPADGWPGSKTTAGIKKFQIAAEILVDGIVGPQTRNARRHWPTALQRITRPILDNVINPAVNKIYGATKWPFIALHYSVSNSGDMVDIDRWHRAIGWKKGGYHAVFPRDGSTQTGDEYPQYLRRHDEAGAHLKGLNYKALGGCFITLDGEITPGQLAAGQLWIASMKRHGCGYERIDGHRFFPGQATSCPGTLPIDGLVG